MSWLARSLANSLIPDHRAAAGDEMETSRGKQPESRSTEPLDGDGGRESGEEDEDLGRGVKEDISELTKTLTRQFWGVANFLAPPPSSDAAAASLIDPQEETSDSPGIAGIRSDFAEIGGRFKSGISKLSSHKAVSEISKFASTFLPFGSEEQYDYEEEEEFDRGFPHGAIGVTEEVMAFVRNISMHAETWLDFPLLSDDEDADDFDMSDAQQEHALAVERLSPRLAALRIELCPSHMSEGCFWKIYFVLLHPRLNKHDAELLSTPQIVEARALLSQKLQSRSKLETERLVIETSYRKGTDTFGHLPEHVKTSKDLNETSPFIKQDVASLIPVTDLETEKHPVQTTEIEIVDKSVIEEEPRQLEFSAASKFISIEKFDDDGDDWLEEEGGSTTIPLDNDEDVSFSDLEDDDDRSAPKASNR